MSFARERHDFVGCHPDGSTPAKPSHNPRAPSFTVLIGSFHEMDFVTSHDEIDFRLWKETKSVANGLGDRDLAFRCDSHEYYK